MKMVDCGETSNTVEANQGMVWGCEMLEERQAV
jgi:hypothetical protein